MKIGVAMFDFNEDALNKQEQDANNSKMWLNVANSAANNLLSAPSAAEIQLNQKRAPVNVGLDKVAAGIQDPWEKQKKTYEAYKAAKEGQDLESDSDENSPKNKALSALLVKQGKAQPGDLTGMTYSQKTALYGNPGKLEEIKAQAQIDLQNKMTELAETHKFQAGENAKNRANDITKERMKADADNKNLPQNVYTAATYGRRLEDANKQMDDLMTAGYDPTSMKNTAIGKVSPEFMKPENMKLMDQAQRNFVNAVLRRESGSAISASEFDSANKQYFPQPGDEPSVLEQKRRNRDVALAGLKTEGAKAWNKMEGNLSTAGASHQPGPSEINRAGASKGKPKTVIQNGHTYTLNPQTGEYE